MSRVRPPLEPLREDAAEKFGRGRDADTLVSVSPVSSASRARCVRAHAPLLGVAVALVVASLGGPAGSSPAERAPAGGLTPPTTSFELGAFAFATRARAHYPDAPVTMEPDVVLSPTLRNTVAQLAVAFRAASGRSFHVTSGVRTPVEQAEAMFDKLANGSSLTGLYRDYEAARQIEQAYQRSRRSGRPRCVAAMTRVLVGQIARGLYISRHLYSGAVDVRSRDMSARERRTFRQVALRGRGVRVLEEGRPPHFHLEFPVREP